MLTKAHAQFAPDGVRLLGATKPSEDSTALFHAHFAGECYFYRPIPAG